MVGEGRCGSAAPIHFIHPRRVSWVPLFSRYHPRPEAPARLDLRDTGVIQGSKYLRFALEAPCVQDSGEGHGGYRIGDRIPVAN
jgi:hypothetical protein